MNDDQDEWDAIRTPPGVEWSGRARYAAAATLYNRGLMSAEALEIYRVLSRLDHEDPAVRLSDFATGRAWLVVLRTRD